MNSKNVLFSKEIYYTNKNLSDGFGAQYQKIIQTYIYCRIKHFPFAYTPLEKVQHNYDNDNRFVEKLEKLMNLKDNIMNINVNMNSQALDYGSIVRNFVDENIDNCCENEHMEFIKKCFWEKKEKDFFKNRKINIAIHIRRYDNAYDNGNSELRITPPNDYYLNVMNHIRKKYSNNELNFHVYSQGSISNFKELIDKDVIFYLDHDIIDTFIGMVAAEILVISPSSFSYVAGLMNDGEIYYTPFWHSARKNWINICS